MRRRLIEEKYLGLANKDAREADGLLLTAGQASASLGNRHVVAQRMVRNEGLDAGQPRRGQDFRIRRARPAERDVVAQLAKEQVRILKHEADSGPQVCRVVLPDIHAVDE